jgi:hypothetical protein
VIQIQRSGINEEGAHREEVDGEVPAVLEVISGAVPVIVELREDDDDVWFGVAKAIDTSKTYLLSRTLLLLFLL